jgi:hypothetical protein
MVRSHRLVSRLVLGAIAVASVSVAGYKKEVK